MPISLIQKSFILASFVFSPIYSMLTSFTVLNYSSTMLHAHRLGTENEKILHFIHQLIIMSWNFYSMGTETEANYNSLLRRCMLTSSNDSLLQERVVSACWTQRVHLMHINIPPLSLKMYSLSRWSRRPEYECAYAVGAVYYQPRIPRLCVCRSVIQ